MSNEKVLTIVGAGPGVGAAVAHRFGREGYHLGLIARNEEKLKGLVRDLRSDGITAEGSCADASKTIELQRALDELEQRVGHTDILCYSPLPDVNLIKPVTETTAEDLRALLALNVVGLAAAVHYVLPSMRKKRQGTLLFTTGSSGLSPRYERAASGVTTTAETIYIKMLHDALVSESIYVAHVVIVGPIGSGKQHEPSTIAQHLWELSIRREKAFTIIK